jgi:tRNA nucleotidyltransferase (CCA-adding enzyme)
MTDSLNIRVPGPVQMVVDRVAEAGGKAMLVGGAVIDVAQNREPKDWDLEVFGLGYDRLEAIFADHDPKTVGKAFGIIKMNIDGLDLDLNIPRTDNKVGVGHTGFEVSMDPNMTVAEAARRRDFTINAMAVDLSTFELTDPFGGMADLHAGVLRATDPVLFVQDPLRGLRAMQLLARKAKTVDPATMILIRSMADEFPTLARERIHEEFRKLLLKADKPSVGLEFLRESGWIKWFPELAALPGTPQHADWHPEGDVWVHSLLAADAMAEIRHLIPEKNGRVPVREAFAFGVFMHDIGKPATTITPKMVRDEDPRVEAVCTKHKKTPAEMLFTAYGHDLAGMDPAESFLRRMTDSKRLITLVRAIVGFHMMPYGLRVGKAGKGAYAKLARKMTEAGGDLALIGRMCQCDACATSIDWQTRSLSSGDPNWEHESSKRVFDHVEIFDKDASAVEPKVMGRDLMAAGLKAGPEFGKLLKRAMDIQDRDASLTKDEIVAELLAPPE